MTDRSDAGATGPEEEATMRLLRLAGTRAEIPSLHQARIRRAFLDAARDATRARALRRRALFASGALVAAAALAIAVRVSAPPPIVAPDRAIVATVLRVDGSTARLIGEPADPVALQVERPVRAGDWIETGAGGRAAVRLADGASVRLDRASRARFLSNTLIELAAGRVYVDSGAESPQLEIRTELGIVRDIGTQFEVRTEPAALRVRVRSGIVEVRRGAETASARPGIQLTVDAKGVTSRPFAPHGPEWAWAAALAPSLDSDGQTLEVFLRQLCREQGWTLRYADAKLARDASGIILHGSTAGLRTQEALTVVLATTGLTHRLADGELRIAR